MSQQPCTHANVDEKKSLFRKQPLHEGTCRDCNNPVQRNGPLFPWRIRLTPALQATK